MSSQSVTVDVEHLLKELERVAVERYDGHFAIMRFTTNWRVCFTTPEGWDEIQNMAVGKTLAEAISAALKIEQEGPESWHIRLSMPR
jgi:hypothetical protein